jgi:GTP-binding protein HflX
VGDGFNYTKMIAEDVVLVGIITGSQTEDQVNEYLDELEFLAETSGAVTKKKFTQKVDKPNPKTYVGSGKIEEIRLYVKANNIDAVIFDDELSPSQLRNIERIFEVKILDRNNLILDIFAKRARSADAKTQVELAQYQYLLPRLTRLWTHLDRTKGGIGMRGPGETQIETDRRIITQKISLLKEKLKKIDKQKAVQRGNRGQLVRVALVGYTNVGKSTIMNMLAKSDVFAENKLFATLDTTVRKVVIDNLPFLLSDTVGFIRKLPHQLIESFKSTLDEVREADVLIHVLDISHPSFEDHYKVVNETIADIDKGQNEKPTLVVFNKMDAYNPKPEDIGYHPDGKKFALEGLKSTWMSKLGDNNCIFISAQEKTNIPELKSRMYEEVKAVFQVRYPYHNFLY